MLGNVAVTDCMEYGHVPRLGNEVCGQTADDKNPVLPQQGLIGIVHDNIRRRENAGEHNAGGGKNLADEAILRHALGRGLAPDLADDVCAEECDGIGDGAAAQGQLDGADMQAGAPVTLAMTMLIANNVIKITKFSFVFFIFAPILVSLRLVYISVCRWWRTGWLSLHREAFYLSAPAPCPL